MSEKLDYALVGLTVKQLAAVRDAVARDVDARRAEDAPVTPELQEGLRKLTYYHDRRVKR